jgi:isoleucyl-tRNA synthetase
VPLDEQKYILHDGPPTQTATSTLNGFEQILKISSSSQNSWQADSQYVPWDCQAPVEHEVEKSLGSRRWISVVEIRQRCRYAAQLSGFSEKSLSVWACLEWKSLSP